VGAFATPFVSSDFDPDLPAPVIGAMDAINSGTSWLENTVRGVAGDALTELGLSLGEDARDFGLDGLLGEVGVSASGEPVTWASCLAEGASPFERCMKSWIAHKAGIPVGEQYILGVITGLFSEGELFLATLLLLFSVLFPLSKVALTIGLSLTGPKNAPGPFRVLKVTSKWSMTDVFVVALLVTFFKAESFNFHFEAELGVYLFAIGAIASSIAVQLLERSVKRPATAPTAE